MYAKERNYIFHDFSDVEIETFLKSVGRNVQNLRKSRGLSQLDLSLLIGNKSVSLVAGAEAGYKTTKFNLEHLYKIAKVLDCKVSDFFESENPNQQP